jgi:hypothetical protein
MHAVAACDAQDGLFQAELGFSFLHSLQGNFKAVTESKCNAGTDTEFLYITDVKEWHKNSRNSAEQHMYAVTDTFNMQGAHVVLAFFLIRLTDTDLEAVSKV